MIDLLYDVWEKFLLFNFYLNLCFQEKMVDL